MVVGGCWWMLAPFRAGGMGPLANGGMATTFPNRGMATPSSNGWAHNSRQQQPPPVNNSDLLVGGWWLLATLHRDMGSHH